jgi:cation:H+ antiporter
MLTAVLFCLSGLVLLYFGAEGLVRGGANLGLRLGLSPLVVGLTIVAFGTSAPELAVSLNAVLAGNTDVATANVVGSNIANIGLILGLSTLVTPIAVHVRLIRVDIPIMIGASLLMAVLMANGVLTRPDGALLFAGIIGFTAFSIVAARRSAPDTQARYGEELAQELPPPGPGLWRDVVLVVAGLLVLTLGGRLLVTGAIDIARAAGLSETVIGLTIVAVGTSLPELATSILAALKKMGDISTGNIIGSNIFNVLGILGASSLVAPLPRGGLSWIDIGVMLAFALAVLPLARSGFVLKRWEGGVFLLGYVIYLTWLVATAA